MKLVVTVIAILLLLAGTTGAAPKPTTIEFIDFADFVEARAINNAGDIVGHFLLGAGSFRRGFIKKATGELITLGDNEFPQGIDDEGRVVILNGQAGISSLYQNGQQTSLHFPGARDTHAYGINGGKIVGTATDVFGLVKFGFLFENGNWTRLDVPGALSTVAYGINDKDEIVGNWTDQEGEQQGFVYAAGQYQTISFGPEGDQCRVLYAINKKGIIIGGSQGIVVPTPCGGAPIAVINGKVFPIDLPQAVVTGINDKGIIVGSLGNKGFIATLNSFILRK